MADREPDGRTDWGELLRALPHGVLWLGADGSVRGANPAASRVLGVDADALSSARFGEPPLEFTDATRAAYGLSVLTASRSESNGKGARRQTVAHVGSDGGTRWFELAPAPLADGGTIVSLHDVTEARKAGEALRLDETALETSLNAVAFGAMDGSLRYVNPSFLRLWGYDDASEVVGKQVGGYWADREAAERVLSRLQRGERAIEGDLVARRRDGERRQVHFTASIALDAAGNPLGVLGTFLDVTERARQAEARRESETRLRAIFDAEPECVKLVSREGILLDMNPAGLSMLEVDTPEEAIGHPIISMVVPEHRESFVAMSRKVFEGESVIGEFEIVGRKGTHRLMETHAVPLRDEETGTVSLLAVTRDITAKKRAQDALRESEEKLRGLYELSPLGIALTDMDGRYVEFNDAFVRICGYPVDELRQLDYWTLTPREYEKQEAKQLEALAETGRYGPYEKEYVQKNGRRIPIRLNGMLVADRAGHRHIWSIVEDISAQRSFEEERRYVEDQLRQSQKLESLGSLAGGVAHDMNNVLAAIVSLAGVELASAAPGSSLRDSLETIVRAAERGGAVVKGLLGFARRGLDREGPVDLNAIVREEASILERTTYGKIRVSLDLEAGLRPVKGDPAALSHALMNLCVNAIDAMPDGGTLTLRTRDGGSGQLLLEVEDEGAGMSADVQARAFDPFFTTKPDGRGTGLGLAIVYGAVKAHGGQIELRSEQGRGTTVAIRLPACESQTRAGESTSALARPGAGLRVLVVDDDEFIQKSCTRVLAVFGHESRVAGNGEDALKLLEEGLEVDAVVLDLNMPGIGGAATLRQLRDRWPDLPVLLATGRADQGAMDLVKSTSRVALLPKPYAPPVLNEQLQQIAGRWPRERRS